MAMKKPQNYVPPTSRLRSPVPTFRRPNPQQARLRHLLRARPRVLLPRLRHRLPCSSHMLCTEPAFIPVSPSRPSFARARENLLSCHTQVLRSPLVQLRVHDREQGCLRRHLLQQEPVCRPARHVLAEGDQPNGARDALLFGVKLNFDPA